MASKVRVELPTTRTIVDLVTPVRGWIASDSPVSEIQILYGNQPITTQVVHRGDVERAFPGTVGIGFSGKLDFRSHFPSASDADVSVIVAGETHKVATVVSSAVRARSVQWATTKSEKLLRVKSIMACPVCRTDITVPTDNGTFPCGNCSESYASTSTHVDLLPEQFRAKFQLISTENVSAHAYPNEGIAFFEAVSKQGGLVLDMGSGDQAFIHPSVICSEIVAYSATDVLAVGQRLPFRNASLEGVYSNAVLEHVTDPFACAEEIWRVLKPGGRVFCSVPFLQPEHGYPHHYYNMTQDGLLNLFTRLGATVEAMEVPSWGHPLYTGQWFLSSYLSALAPGAAGAIAVDDHH